MNQERIIERLSTALEVDPRVRGLFLAGSFGAGTADSYSDIDLVAVLDEGTHEQFTEDFREVLEQILPVVLWKQRGKDSILLNAITEDWQRVDLYTTSPGIFQRGTQDSLRPLFDHDGIFQTLQPKSQQKKPDHEKIAHAISEFIRVLGLLHVVVGRHEYYTAVSGLGMQRDQLAVILIERDAVQHTGGALHLSRIISPESMQILTSLPVPRANRREVIEAHFEVARAFFPVARRLAEKLGMVWPEAFERATSRMLKAQFGAEFDVNWN